MNNVVMPESLKRRVEFRAWRETLRSLAAAWMDALPNTVIGVDQQTSFLVRSSRGDDPARSRLPQDESEWQALGWTFEETDGVAARSLEPRNRRSTKAAKRALRLANFLAESPDAAVQAMRALGPLLAATAQQLRRYSDPSTLQVRRDVQRLCDFADKVLDAQEQSRVSAKDLEFARQPVIKAMLLYAAAATPGEPIHVKDLRDAVARSGLEVSQRTHEKWLEDAKDNCEKCSDGTCTVRHRGYFTRPAGRSRHLYAPTPLGLRCAEALLEEDYLRSLSEENS